MTRRPPGQSNYGGDISDPASQTDEQKNLNRLNKRTVNS